MNEDLFDSIPPFERALSFAYRSHDGQYRKGTNIPYISHPLAVASIVLECGGDECEATAALLHDVIEDQTTPAERLKVKNHILHHFGEEVLEIVEGCSDTLAESPVGVNGEKEAWKARKTKYLKHLKQADPSTLLVSAADKLHNAKSILRDYSTIGESFWSRFNSTKQLQLWYYSELVNIFESTNTESLLVRELAETVAVIKKFDEKLKARKGKPCDNIDDLTDDEYEVILDDLAAKLKADPDSHLPMTDEELQETGAINTTLEDEGGGEAIIGVSVK